jgi:HK97 family phage major capsid protein
MHKFFNPEIGADAERARGFEMRASGSDLLDRNEGDIRKLADEVRKLEAEQVTQRAAADKLRDDILSTHLDADGKPDANALTRDEFDKIDAEYRVADETMSTITDLKDRQLKMYGWAGRAGNGPGSTLGGDMDAPVPGMGRGQTIGMRARSSEKYQELLERKTLKNDKAQFGTVELCTITRDEVLGQWRQRAGLDLTSGQAIVTPEFQLIPPVELPVRAPRIVSLINSETTDTDAVVWGQQTQRVLASAPTASGIPAPEATLAFTRQTSMVRRIPVLLTVPKEVLADEGRLQGILDVQLMADVGLTVEAQVLSGDGSGEDFLGILQQEGIGSTEKIDGDYALDTIHRGITYVRTHLFDEPDGIGLHPVDLEGIMLQKDNLGRYVFDPSAEQTSIWGFRTTPSTVFTAGNAVVGSWRLGATIWMREDVVITATDGYTDVASGTNYFSAGLVAILAQVRAAFAVTRPFAFCEVTGL